MLPEGATPRQCVLYSLDLIAKLKACNNDKATVRKELNDGSEPIPPSL